VIVGWSRSFTFDVIARVADVVRHGARFIATNDDPTHPTPEGLLPGTGALVSAIATAAETLPTIAGKPGKAMAALVQERSEKICMVIGDRPSTDGAFAQILGVDFGLVRSEATPAIADIGPLEGPSLLAVVEDFLAPSSRASR
jgi:ribonucleotide monophosphatase NagD (HAD superfamily)